MKLKVRKCIYDVSTVRQKCKVVKTLWSGASPTSLAENGAFRDAVLLCIRKQTGFELSDPERRKRIRPLEKRTVNFLTALKGLQGIQVFKMTKKKATKCLETLNHLGQDLKSVKDSTIQSNGGTQIIRRILKEVGELSSESGSKRKCHAIVIGCNKPQLFKGKSNRETFKTLDPGMVNMLREMFFNSYTDGDADVDILTNGVISESFSPLISPKSKTKTQAIGNEISKNFQCSTYNDLINVNGTSHRNRKLKDGLIEYFASEIIPLKISRKFLNCIHHLDSEIVPSTDQSIVPIQSNTRKSNIKLDKFEKSLTTESVDIERLNEFKNKFVSDLQNLLSNPLGEDRDASHTGVAAFNIFKENIPQGNVQIFDTKTEEAILPEAVTKPDMAGIKIEKEYLTKNVNHLYAVQSKFASDLQTLHAGGSLAEINWNNANDDLADFDSSTQKVKFVHPGVRIFESCKNKKCSREAPRNSSTNFPFIIGASRISGKPQITKINTLSQNRKLTNGKLKELRNKLSCDNFREISKQETKPDQLIQKDNDTEFMAQVRKIERQTPEKWFDDRRLAISAVSKPLVAELVRDLQVLKVIEPLILETIGKENKQDILEKLQTFTRTKEILSVPVFKEPERTAAPIYEKTFTDGTPQSKHTINEIASFGASNTMKQVLFEICNDIAKLQQPNNNNVPFPYQIETSLFPRMLTKTKIKRANISNQNRDFPFQIERARAKPTFDGNTMPELDWLKKILPETTNSEKSNTPVKRKLSTINQSEEKIFYNEKLEISNGDFKRLKLSDMQDLRKIDPITVEKFSQSICFSKKISNQTLGSSSISSIQDYDSVKTPVQTSDMMKDSSDSDSVRMQATRVFWASKFSETIPRKPVDYAFKKESTGEASWNSRKSNINTCINNMMYDLQQHFNFQTFKTKSLRKIPGIRISHCSNLALESYRQDKISNDFQDLKKHYLTVPTIESFRYENLTPKITQANFIRKTTEIVLPQQMIVPDSGNKTITTQFCLKEIHGKIRDHLMNSEYESQRFRPYNIKLRKSDAIDLKTVPSSFKIDTRPISERLKNYCPVITARQFRKRDKTNFWKPQPIQEEPEIINNDTCYDERCYKIRDNYDVKANDEIRAIKIAEDLALYKSIIPPPIEPKVLSHMLLNGIIKEVFKHLPSKKFLPKLVRLLSHPLLRILIQEQMFTVLPIPRGLELPLSVMLGKNVFDVIKIESRRQPLPKVIAVASRSFLASLAWNALRAYVIKKTCSTYALNFHFIVRSVIQRKNQNIFQSNIFEDGLY